MNESSKNLPARLTNGAISTITPPGSFASRANASAATPDPITLGFVWRSLQHWWKIALPVALLLGAGAGAAMYLNFQRMYRATAWLEIKEQPDYIAFKTDGNSRFVQNQVELLRGPLVLERVLSKPEVAQLPEVREQASPLEWLQRNLTARNVGGSDLFELSFVGPQPANAATIVNMVVQSYLEVSSHKIEEQTRRVVGLLTTERERRAKEVERMRESVRTLAKQLTGKDPFAPARETFAPQSPLATLQDRLANTEVEREVLEARLTALSESLAQSPQEISNELIDQMLDARPEITKEKQEIANDHVRLDDFQRLAQPGSPQFTQGLSRLSAQIEQDEKFLDEIRGKLRKFILAEMSDAETKRRKDMLVNLKNEIANLQVTEQVLRSRIGQLSKAQIETGGNAVELEFAKGELQRAENVFDRIADRILALTTETNAPERVTQLRPATVPTEPEVKSPLKMVLLASLAGFSLPFVFVIAWERKVRRILEPAQIADEANLQVVGEIASLPVRRLVTTPNGRPSTWAHLVFEESIDCLRTMLALSEHWKELQVISIVSAVSQEGKTSLSTQLALSLARATGKAVLLIDGDMRSPDLHEIFDVPSEPGLVQVLSNGCTVQDAVRHTAANPLVDLLPAGRLLKSPHVLLGNGKLRKLIDDFREKYAYIVIDTPPVLSASEALAFAKTADGVLICTLREASRAAQVRLAHQRLSAVGCNVIGVVLSGVPTRSYTHKYGAYRYVNSP